MFIIVIKNYEIYVWKKNYIIGYILNNDLYKNILKVVYL